LRKHVLAQKADRSRSYGRIGNVTQIEQKPVIIDVTVDYPTMNRRETIYTHSRGFIKKMEPTHHAVVHMTCTSQKPFYFYGSFRKNGQAYLMFLEQVFNPQVSVRVNPPLAATDFRIHASELPPSGYSYDYLNESKRRFMASRAAVSSDQAFLNLGFTPVNNPERYLDEEPGIISGDLKYWDGKRNSYDPRTHGYGPFTTSSKFESYFFDLDKEMTAKLPLPFASRPRVWGDSVRHRYFWLNVAEYVEGKGWKVLDRNDMTLKAGVPYKVFGGVYVPHNRGRGADAIGIRDKNVKMIPAEGVEAPTFAFIDPAALADYTTQPSGEIEMDVRAKGKKNCFPFKAQQAPYTGFIPSIGLLSHSNKPLLQRSGFMDDAENLTPHAEAIADMPICTARIEYFSGNGWSTTRPNETTTSMGRFDYIIRFPRQLQEGHPDLDVSPASWAIANSRFAYQKLYVPNGDREKTAIAHVNLSFDAGTLGFNFDKNTLEMSNTRPQYQLCIANMPVWENNMYDAGYLIHPLTFKIADPENFAYSTNQDIDRLFFEDGDFGPGKHVIYVGKGLDRSNTCLITAGTGMTLEPLAREFGGADGVYSMFIQSFVETNAAATPGKVGFMNRVTSINAKQLEEGQEIPANLQSIFMRLFKQPLNMNFFSLFNAQTIAGVDLETLEQMDSQTKNRLGEMCKVKMAPLPGQVRPGYYAVADESGDMHEFPYTVAVFKVSDNYNGPMPLIKARLPDGNIISKEEARKMVEDAYSAQASLDSGIIETKPELDYFAERAGNCVFWFQNVLGREMKAGEEQLGLELEFQLEKERLGLAKLEQFLTETAEDFTGKNVEDLLMGEQHTITGGDGGGDGGSDGPRGPLFSLTFPPWFGRFKTNNLLRQHTLIPYGEKMPLDDTTED
jgi:hypothetical protein